MDDDEQRRLADAARDGDARSWEQLYRNAYPRLFAYAATRVGRHAAEDAVNETMARAVAGIRRFRWSGGGFDAWLFGILRRVCLEHHRKRQAHERVPPADLWVDHADPADTAQDRADAEVRRRAFASLDESDRDILALRLLSGLPAEDVARLVGKSAGAVRTAQSRALANLRLLVRQEM